MCNSHQSLSPQTRTQHPQLGFPDNQQTKKQNYRQAALNISEWGSEAKAVPPPAPRSQFHFWMFKCSLPASQPQLFNSNWPLGHPASKTSASYSNFFIQNLTGLQLLETTRKKKLAKKWSNFSLHFQKDLKPTYQVSSEHLHLVLLDLNYSPILFAWIAKLSKCNGSALNM